MMDVHRCTEDDMSQFYPVSTIWTSSYERRTVDGLLQSFCVDWNEVGIQNKGSAADYEKFEVIFAPCNYMHSSIGHEDEPVAEECI